MTITLRPTPGAQVILFPSTQAEEKEAFSAQLSNIHSHLVAKYGSYVGRHMFIEASMAVAVRYAFANDTLHDTRAGIEEAFDRELDLLAPTTGAA